MSQVLVIKVDGEKRASAIFIDHLDIIFFASEEQKIAVHTKSERFFLPNSLEDCTLLDGFERIDRCYIARTEQISHYDKNLQLLHFKGTDKRCYVSNTHRKRLNLK
ncbi:MAG: LytTR family transcriptional regulator DNA-binding domain-containing protein [Paenibacillaceae bacterium]